MEVFVLIEYKVVEVKTSGEAQEIMNDLAKIGWEVDSIAFANHHAYLLIIVFSRNLDNPFAK